ncbi:MAG TPA: AI-2E family transporter [Bacteroidaceae bacterium]|nr:AI-2E family transporter [Bacteroidaceae bacterium]
MQLKMPKITSRIILIVVGVVILGLLVWRFSNIVAYILVAAVLSLIARPLVRLLGKIKIWKFRIPVSIRALFTLFVIWGIFFGFFRIFIPLIANEAQDLSNIDPEQIMIRIEGPMEKLNEWYNRMNLNEEGFTSIENLVGEKIKSVLNVKLITDLIGTTAGILGNLFWAVFAISFITFFLLREEKLLSESLVLMVPKEYESEIRHALASIKYLLRRYFIGILLQMTGILTLITVGMTIIGVGFRHGIVIGLLAAVLNIIPYLGPWIGAALGVTLGVATHLHLDFSTELLPLIGYMVSVFAVTQIIDNTIFQPFIFGTSVMAHPLEIFIVIMIAGSLAGVAGMILAIPTYTVFRVFAKEFFNNFRLIQKLTERI